ncbi:MAG: hypothetical protein H6Q30_1945 [Bacteroidetes bacterium]|nr:hypothetical protein [Bacteroidota bacterium]
MGDPGARAQLTHIFNLHRSRHNVKTQQDESLPCCPPDDASRAGKHPSTIRQGEQSRGYSLFDQLNPAVLRFTFIRVIG